MNLEKVNVGGNEYDISDPKVRSMVSDAYNQDTQYAVGDYCIYENALYKCVTAATGAWDATKWKKTAVGTELREQNVKMIKIMKKTYEISCTTSYASTIGYKGSKNISSDFPSSLIAVIPLGCTQTTDSGRVGNIIYREDGNLYLNMPISCTAHAEVLFLYT